ncbi:MAG: polysaccharide pyruvyl transferase CsaB [Acidaminococcales bacterium]|nr:polysaccharide pyruvyl transferase CsaB [Acidaminococcales bacterium]
MKHKNILISGYYGFANAGDEAMLTAVIDALRGLTDSPAISVLSGNPAETAARHGVKAIHRFDPVSLFWAARKADIVLSGGGSLLQDVTSKRSLYYYLGVLQLAKLLNKPVMLYGQGIGPLRAAMARRLAGFVCRQADVIAVRDKQSLKELALLGVDEKKTFLTADPVMAMHPADKGSGRSILHEHGVEGGFLAGISAREWQGAARFKKELAGAADALVREYGAKIIFLPLQYPGDLMISKEIASLMAEKDSATVIEKRCGVNDFLSLVGNMDLLLGIRLHALIFGALMQVPVIGLSYDPKIDAFLESIGGQPAGDLARVTAEKIMDEARRAIADKSLAARRHELLGDLRAGAMKNAHLAVELLNGGRQLM